MAKPVRFWTAVIFDKPLLPNITLYNQLVTNHMAPANSHLQRHLRRIRPANRIYPSGFHMSNLATSSPKDELAPAANAN
jgi:hypothetical protein